MSNTAPCYGLTPFLGYFSIPINNSLSAINMVAQVPNLIATLGTATGTTGWYTDEPIIQNVVNFGSGAGTWWGHPSWENAAGFAQDISTGAGIVAAAFKPLPSANQPLFGRKLCPVLRAAEQTGAFSRLAQPGGLTVSEDAGGHLLAMHVGLTDADLAARLSSQPGITAASTFATRAEAEAAVGAAFDANAANVSAWTSSGANGRLVLNAPFSGGSVLQRGASAAAPGTGVRVVLQGNGSGGYYILTGFPTP